MSIKIVSDQHEKVINELFDNAKKSIKIISPFIQTGMAKKLIQKVNEIAKLEINVITKFSKKDFMERVSNINAVNMLYSITKELLAVQGLHTKLYIFDDSRVLIGSANFTYGGFRYNQELSLLIENDEKSIIDLVKYFNDYICEIKKQENTEITEEVINKIITELKRLDETKINSEKKGCNVLYLKEEYGAEFNNEIEYIENNTNVDIVEHALQKDINYNNNIFLKFEGENNNRVDINDKYGNPIMIDNKVATFFNVKPNVDEDDYIYVAVVCKDRNHPNLTINPYIVGRGRTIKFDTSNVATKEMIAENKWMKRWNNYILLKEFEILDTEIKNAISLSDILNTLKNKTYKSTANNQETNYKISHHQCSHLYLTSEAKNYIDLIFDERLKKYNKRNLKIEINATIDNKDIKIKFEKEIINNITECEKIGYNPFVFKKMISNGIIEAIKGLLSIEKAEQHGFTELYIRRRLDLTAEAVVAKEEYKSLFTEDEIAVAKKRLLEHEYKI